MSSDLFAFFHTLLILGSRLRKSRAAGSGDARTDPNLARIGKLGRVFGELRDGQNWEIAAGGHLRRAKVSVN
jgi:hypothetical protein